MIRLIVKAWAYSLLTGMFAAAAVGLCMATYGAYQAFGAAGIAAGIFVTGGFGCLAFLTATE